MLVKRCSKNVCCYTVNRTHLTACFFVFLDGSYRHSFRQGYTSPPGRSRVVSDSPLHMGTEKHFRRFRRDRPRLDSLEWRGEREHSTRPPSITSAGEGNSCLTLHSTHYRHEDSCSTCSSSSDSEEEGFFLGQRIPLPPQMTGEKEREGKRAETEEKSKRGSLRRRTQSFSVKDKDKDKNCLLSWENTWSRNQDCSDSCFRSGSKLKCSRHFNEWRQH